MSVFSPAASGVLINHTGLFAVLRELARWPAALLHISRAFLLSRKLKRKPMDAYAAAKLSAWQLGLLKVCGVRLEVCGEPVSTPALWVGNHISWLDAPAVGVYPDTVCVAKSEVADWPLLGRLVRSVGTIFIKRGGNHVNQVRDQIVETLEQGKNVMVFPEATTTAGDRVSYIFPRLLSAASTAGLPIQPISFAYSNSKTGLPVAPYIDDMQFLPHLRNLLRARGVVCTLRFLPAIESDQPRDVLANKVRQALAEPLNLAVSDNQKRELNLRDVLRFIKSRHGV